ncbi:MAG: hypothetical protein JXB04_11485 [Kiritimatiellae bacterium]|nr:hypothetical protein [Kiritimatiellia bacterium]
MSPDDPVPAWSPRVPQARIRRLYETDARGIYDDELVDDVGYRLLARCESFIRANEAVAGKARCPRCSATIQHSCRKEEVLKCECGWKLTWGEYFKTIQHRQLSGAEVLLQQFREFVAKFPAARTPQDKMSLIDRLIHGFHGLYKTGSPLRPVAVNLIDGRMDEVVAFLDKLAYGEAGTPGLAEARAEWEKCIEKNRDWYPSWRKNRAPERT